MTGEPATIAILGGTGQLGSALALRFAKAGYHVILGSREALSAQAAALAINDAIGSGRVSGDSNEAAAAAGGIVVLTVPYAAQRATVEAVREALRGKILIDTTVPLMPPQVACVQLPPEGSAVAAIQARLGGAVRVVSAFQTVAAHHLRDLDHAIQGDVLVCGDDAAARATVIALAADIGLAGFHAGPICNSAAAEALTSALIAINQHYKRRGAGIRIAGVPAPGARRRRGPA